MCSYGSFSRNAKPPKRDPNAVEKPRGLSAYERRFGFSMETKDIQFVTYAKDGLRDSLEDCLRDNSLSKPSSINCIVRVGGRSQTNKPTTALHVASQNGHVEVCRTLIEYGADPSRRIELSRVLTPLHLAASPEVVHVLLEGGATGRFADPRIPEPAWYHHQQNRHEVALAIEEYNQIQKDKRKRRKHALVRLQSVWDRLNGMVVGLNFIRQFQKDWKEKFYNPDNQASGCGFLHIGMKRFDELKKVDLNNIDESHTLAIRLRNEVLPRLLLKSPLPMLKPVLVSPCKKSEDQPTALATPAGSSREAILTLRKSSSASSPMLLQKPLSNPQPPSADRENSRSSANHRRHNVKKKTEITKKGHSASVVSAHAWAIENARKNLSVQVGDRILAKNEFQGHVAFVGETNFAPGKLWIGIILDTANGKNNGKINGHVYFKCKKNHGLFLQPASVQPLAAVNGDGNGV
jgi:hypothetical protein